MIHTSAMANILRECGWAKHALTVKWRGKNRRVYFRPEAFIGLSGGELSRALRGRLDETFAADDDRERSWYGEEF